MKQDATQLATFVDLSAADYHADKSRLSHSQRETFIESPELYYGRHVTGEWPQEATAAMDFGTVVHDVILGPQVVFDSSNYYRRTIACFKPCELTKSHKRNPDVISTSGSRYWWHADGITRQSDHWGRVGTCYWALRKHGDSVSACRELVATEGGERLMSAGFCRWDHFLSSRSFLPIPREVLDKKGGKRGNAWKAFAKANSDSILLKESEFEAVPWMLEELRAHPQASKILFSPNGRNEQVIHWTCPATGLPMRSMLDRIWYAPDAIVIADYKSTNDVSQYGFSKRADDFGYMRQSADYTTALQQVEPDSEIGFVFIAQVPKPPYTVEVYCVDEQSRELAERENWQASRDLVECRRTNVWRRKDYGTLKMISSPRYRFNS